MTARDHNKLLGILFLIYGGLQVFGIAIAILMMLGVGGAAIFGGRARDAAPVAIVFGFVIGVLIVTLLFVIPALMAGWKMMKNKMSARTWAIVAACLALISFPLGTALGIYALWFLFGEQGKSFYSGGSAGNFSPPAPNSWQ